MFELVASPAPKPVVVQLHPSFAEAYSFHENQVTRGSVTPWALQTSLTLRSNFASRMIAPFPRETLIDPVSRLVITRYATSNVSPVGAPLHCGGRNPLEASIGTLVKTR